MSDDPVVARMRAAREAFEREQADAASRLLSDRPAEEPPPGNDEGGEG